MAAHAHALVSPCAQAAGGWYAEPARMYAALPALPQLPDQPGGSFFSSLSFILNPWCARWAAPEGAWRHQTEQHPSALAGPLAGQPHQMLEAQLPPPAVTAQHHQYRKAGHVRGDPCVVATTGWCLICACVTLHFRVTHPACCRAQQAGSAAAEVCLMADRGPSAPLLPG